MDNNTNVSLSSVNNIPIPNSIKLQSKKLANDIIQTNSYTENDLKRSMSAITDMVADTAYDLATEEGSTLENPHDEIQARAKLSKNEQQLMQIAFHIFEALRSFGYSKTLAWIICCIFYLNRLVYNYFAIDYIPPNEDEVIAQVIKSPLRFIFNECLSRITTSFIPMMISNPRRYQYNSTDNSSNMAGSQLLQSAYSFVLVMLLVSVIIELVKYYLQIKNQEEEEQDASILYNDRSAL